jgi:cobalt-zinc-cadmium efflux system membrane fusion protein
MIDVPPSKIVSVSFPLGGYIRKMVMLPGTSVKRGSVLATLEDQQLIQLQQDYLMGLSRLHFLETDFTRQQELNKTKATSDKIFQQVKSDFESQQVMVKALSEKLQLIGIAPESLNEKNLSRSIELRSPLDGIISKVNVHSGQYITPTDVLFEILNPKDKHLSLTIFEKDLENLSPGLSVSCYTNEHPEIKYKASILLINRSIGSDRSTEVHCHFEQPHDELVPGMFMNAEIAIQSKHSVCVPHEAVVRWENRNYVFGQLSSNRFEMIPVDLGISGTQSVEITGGQIPNRLVVKNAYTVLMKMKNTSATE